MAFDQQLRQMIREEIESAIAPIVERVGFLQRNDVTAQLRAVLLGGVGKRLTSAVRTSTKKAARAARGVAARPSRSTHACALIGCSRPARSKGYCSAHYQKRRMLERTKRLPSDWKEDAAPHSVTDVVLPRGRAGAKAQPEAKK